MISETKVLKWQETKALPVNWVPAIIVIIINDIRNNF